MKQFYLFSAKWRQHSICFALCRSKAH